MSDSHVECHYFKEKAHHVKKKKKKKNTFLRDKFVNNEGDQNWLSESESENVWKSNRQATVGKAKP